MMMKKPIKNSILGLFLIIPLSSNLVGCSSGNSDSFNGGSNLNNNTDLPSDTVTSTTGSINLSWTPPTTYSDGKALTNLDGYRIYYGTSDGVFTNVINIDNPGITSYVIENLVSNTYYYFVATAYDIAGNESAYSQAASVFIQ